MDDYIRRGEALSEACKGCSIDFPCEPCEPQDCEIKARLQAIPAADVVEVVRCGQCKYCVEHYDTDGNAPYWTCKEWDSGTDYDGYCHYGKRKDGGQDDG